MSPPKVLVHLFYITVGRAYVAVKYQRTLNYHKVGKYRYQKNCCKHIDNNFFRTKCLPILLEEYAVFRQGFHTSTHYIEKDFTQDYLNFGQKVCDKFDESLKVQIREHASECEEVGLYNIERKRSLQECIGHFARYLDCTAQERKWKIEQRIRERMARFEIGYYREY